MADSDPESPEKKRQAPPPLEFLKPGEEQPVPPPEQRPPAAWVTRPDDYQRPQYAQPPAPARTAAQGPGNMARIAGLLLVGAGILSAASLLVNSLTPLSPADYANATKDLSTYALDQVCTLLVVWGQAIMLIGGVMAFQRMNWRMVVGLAFFSTLMLGGYVVAVLSAFIDPLALGAAFLGIAGFVLAVTSRKEFLS